MKKDNLIDNYLYNDYKKSYENNLLKIEILSIIQDNLFKLNYSLDCFLREDFDIILLKEKLSLLEGEEIFINLFLSIYDTLDIILNDYTKMINKISNFISTIKPYFNPYFMKYNEFLNTPKDFLNYLSKIDEAKNNFMEASKNAEFHTFKLLKNKINDIQTDKKEIKLNKDLKTLAKFQLEKYGEEVNKGNEVIKKYNEKQKNFFQEEKNLEIKYNDCYHDCLMSFYESHLILLDYINKVNMSLLEMSEKYSELKIADYLKNYKPKEEIHFIQYKTNIEIDKCKNSTELCACFMTYNEIANYIGLYKEKELYKENKILEVCKEIDRILNLNDKITNNDYNNLMEFLKDDLGKKVFCSLFNLIILNGKHEKSEKFINIIGKATNFLLEYAEKEKNYEVAKDCIKISETFCYLDSKQEKKYIYEHIKNNKWLKGSQFWRELINVILKKESEKPEDAEKQNEENQSTIELLTFYINIMKKYKIDIRIIIKIFDEIAEKNNNLSKENFDTIFSAINNDTKKIEEYRKEYKENPDLENQLNNKGDKHNENNEGEQKNNIVNEIKEDIEVKKDKKEKEIKEVKDINDNNNQIIAEK